MTIRILIADDQQLIRHALHTLVDTEADLEIVGDASDVPETLHLSRLLQPDLVLLDLAIGRGKGIDLLTSLRHHQPAACVLILTSVEDEEVVVQALQAGAAGYLLKSIAPHDLIQALRTAVRGGTPLHPRIASLVLHRLQQPSPEPKPQPKLTARERQVLDLLAQGRSNREIAKELVITQFTVRTHVCRVLKKLNLSNRTQAALYLIRQEQH